MQQRPAAATVWVTHAKGSGRSTALTLVPGICVAKPKTLGGRREKRARERDTLQIVADGIISIYRR